MKNRIALAVCACVPLAVACGGVADGTTEPFPEATGTTMEPIIGGTPASGYPEAARLDMVASTGATYACSATLIAPKVVLTAGHCVDGMVSWNVYVGGVARPASGGETYDWHENGATTVNPAHHDIGLVYLSTAINLATYPTLSTAMAAKGAAAIDVGRILNGTLTNSLYQANTTLTDATAVGYPYDYYSADVIEHGDSGGPVFLKGTHQIAAVNSGAGSGTQVLARVDLLNAWIAARIASHGGTTGTSGTGGATGASGATGTGGATATGGKPATGGTTAAGGATSTGGKPATGGTSSTGGTTSSVCTAEKEANDDVAHANALAGSACGSLSKAGDVDWYTMTAPVGTTTVSLTADRDATYSIGFLAGTTCSTSYTGVRSTQIKVAGAPVKICIAVSSATKTIQNYKAVATSQ